MLHGAVSPSVLFVHGALKYNNNNIATRDVGVHADLQRNDCCTFMMYHILSKIRHSKCSSPARNLSKCILIADEFPVFLIFVTSL